MADSTYALICPHCMRKLRAPEAAAGWEGRCSLCHSTFVGPAISASRRADRLPRVKTQCPCGKPVAMRSSKEDIRILCQRCHRWVVVFKRQAPTDQPSRDTSFLPAVPAAAPAGGGPDDELDRARHVVAELLPSEPPSVPGMDIAVFHQFRHEVGGDYYDFLPLPDGRLGIALGDVSGSGVGAAMLLVRLREILHSVAPHAASPAETVATVNARLVQNTPRGMFITFLYAVLDPATRELRSVNAGHGAPMVWRARLTGVRVLPGRGPALGLLPDEQFARAISERALTVEPEDCLCLYTDGAFEARNARGEEFGEPRLAAALRRHVGRSAKEITDAMVAAIAAHTGRAAQHDDMTLIVLKALPPPADAAPPEPPLTQLDVWDVWGQPNEQEGGSPTDGLE